MKEKDAKNDLESYTYQLKSAVMMINVLEEWIEHN